MNELIIRAREYINKILGFEAAIEARDLNQKLAAYLTSLYDFYSLRLENHEFILMVDNSGNFPNPSSINKHLTAVQTKLGIQPVYVCESMSRDARREMIKHRTPFIVPHNQLYLPCIGFDLKEHFPAKISKVGKFSPFTQFTALTAILMHDYDILHVSLLAEKIGYSIATASRVITELKKIGALSCERNGKERRCTWKSRGSELWKLLLPRFTDPLRKNHYIIANPDILPVLRMAGLTALAHYSLLAEPNIPVYACSFKIYNKLNKAGKIVILDYPSGDAVELQVWNYDPIPLTNSDFVDPLSLYLSIKNDPDDRTQLSLKEMMRKIQW